MSPSIGPWRLRFVIIDGDIHLDSFLTNHGVNKVATINLREENGQEVRRFNISVN